MGQKGRKMSQHDLLAFVEQPSIKPTNREVPLLIMVESLANAEISIPEFQRDYIWNKRKLKGWINTVISGRAIGVIVTYQIMGMGPVFLADGLQRLTATMYFLNDPQAYGYKFGTDQAERICKAFDITQQHRHYETHNEAWIGFQNINRGTVLTPAEFHKGELVMDLCGKIVYSKIPDSVIIHQSPFMKSHSFGRSQESRLRRDAFALFLQYISKTDKMDFWNVSATQVGRGISVESELVRFFNEHGYSPDDTEKAIKQFSQFIGEQAAELRQILEEAGQKGKHMSPTVFRWLLHLTIWRRNTRKELSLYQQFVMRFFEMFKDHKSISSRFPKPGITPVEFCSLTLSSLRDLAQLCDGLDVPLHKRNKPNKKVETSVGYNESHEQPFSIHGDGPTFIEPAPRNKSRGARPANR